MCTNVLPRHDYQLSHKRSVECGAGARTNCHSSYVRELTELVFKSYAWLMSMVLCSYLGCRCVWKQMTFCVLYKPWTWDISLQCWINLRTDMSRKRLRSGILIFLFVLVSKLIGTHVICKNWAVKKTFGIWIFFFFKICTIFNLNWWIWMAYRESITHIIFVSISVWS